MPCRAIIFDCDGVLIDSEPFANRAMSLYLAERSIVLSPEECAARWVGRSMPDVADDIRAMHGLEILDDLRARWVELLLATAGGTLPCVQGCAAVLSRLRAPLACASNSDPGELRIKLDAAGLAHHFHPHIYSAPNLGRPKPAPDVYLHAARALGVAPRETIVVEDSRSGVAAAHAAGASVIGFTGASHAGPTLGAALREAGACRIVADWDSLGALLESGLADRD